MRTMKTMKTTMKASSKAKAKAKAGAKTKKASEIEAKTKKRKRSETESEDEEDSSESEESSYSSESEESISDKAEMEEDTWSPRGQEYHNAMNTFWHWAVTIGLVKPLKPIWHQKEPCTHQRELWVTNKTIMAVVQRALRERRFQTGLPKP